MVYRLVDLQIIQNPAIKVQSAELYFSVDEIPARRGEIMDRHGKTLAISCEEPYIFADPSKVEDPRATVAALSKVLKRDRAWRREKIKQLSNRERNFCYVVRRVAPHLVEEVRRLKLPGIHFGEDIWRTYPNGWIASHVIGFVTWDGETKEGLELFYDDGLRGKPGSREILRDGRRRRIDMGTRVVREPVMGSDIQLTIDANIQFFAENALRRALKTTRADNITAIVMDPRSGAIHAMANIPDFDPNRFNQYRSFRRKNRAVVDVYDPASAFKIVTVAAGLDSGAIDLDDVIFCENGGIEIHGKHIRDHQAFGNLNISQILWHSSNVGVIKIARKLRPETFHRYIRAFGFGEKTGIDLPAESAGILAPVSEWEKISPAYLSIGHEISVTPLQMLMAASVIANRGLLIKPYLAAKRIHADGRLEDLRPHGTAQRVIKSQTASLLVEALRGVVEHGTAKAAQIPGVSVFGKTGTAQRLHNGSYARDKFNASFVGFFPVEEPRYGIMVVVHNPKGGKVHGGEVAAPIFAEIGKQIILYDRSRKAGNPLPVVERTPDWPARAVAANHSSNAMPDLTGLGLRNLIYQSRHLGIKLRIKGQGRVVGQWPRPGEPIPSNRVCSVALKEG